MTVIRTYHQNRLNGLKQLMLLQKILFIFNAEEKVIINIGIDHYLYQAD